MRTKHKTKKLFLTKCRPHKKLNKVDIEKSCNFYNSGTLNCLMCNEYFLFNDYIIVTFTFMNK